MKEDNIFRDYGVLQMIVHQNGEQILKTNWDSEIRRNVYSAAKSFTSVAVGIAQQEGLLTLDEKLSDVFVKDLTKNPSQFLNMGSIRDLLTMGMGQKESLLMAEQRAQTKEKDWVKWALAQPFSDSPGTKFKYSNVGPYLAGIIVQRRAGCKLVDYLMPRFFEPLDILRPTWECDPEGNTFGAGGLMLGIEDLHKLGRLFLQRGIWNGIRILPEHWIKEASSKQIEVSDGHTGYGYLFWLGEDHTYRADGMYGQYSIVVPDKCAVVSAISECRKPNLLQLIHERIIQQL
jgi:CubicO group peptidase (beta-lactamase class C family)